MIETKKPIRLQRVVIAALLAEMIPIIVLFITVILFAYLVSPGMEAGIYKDFASRAGKIINPLAGSLATFGMAYWAAAKPENGKVMHGILTGVVVIFIELAILATPGSDFGTTEALGMTGKFIAAALGGFAAQRQAHKKRPAAGQPII